MISACSFNGTKLSRPMVRRGTDFHAGQISRKTLKKWQKLTAEQSPVRRTNVVDVKSRLCEINPDSDNFVYRTAPFQVVIN